MFAMAQQDCATRIFTTPAKGKQRLTQSQLDNIAHEVGFEYTRAKDLLNYATFETDMLIGQIQSIEPGQVAPSESNSVTRMDLAALVTKRCGRVRVCDHSFCCGRFSTCRCMLTAVRGCAAIFVWQAQPAS